MENVREHIYLAALLHDLGKFYQRAGSKSDRILSGVSSDKKINIWLREIEAKIDLTFKGNIILSDVYDLMSGIDNPKTELQALVSMAKAWSSGGDRRMIGECEHEKNSAFLYSIFNQINNGSFTNTFPLEVLNIETDSCFPNEENYESDDVDRQYRVLWDSFLSEFSHIPNDSFDIFVNSVSYLLKKYMWAVPVNSTDMNDISLFENIKITVAFADCLFRYKEKNPHHFVWNEKNYTLTIEDNCEPIILLGCDISGIQSFIYDIASRKAAVSLKGRSFYLQLLIDVCIQRILSHEVIKATQNHVIYSSGGKFYMILPNTEEIIDALNGLRREFEEYLWREHFGKLVLNLDYVPFCYSTITDDYRSENQGNKKISNLWRRLADKLSECKRVKFETLIRRGYEKLFIPQSIYEKMGKTVKVCAVTGIESGECVKIDETEDSVFVLPQIKKQIKLGNALKDADYFLLRTVESNLNSDNEIMGMEVNLLSSNENSVDLNGFVRKINNTDFLPTKEKGMQVVHGFQFYGGNRQAEISNGRLKTFEDLASDTYLGVLRMDVDGLSSIFIKGLPDQKQNFSSYSTLSFLLDFFFSGYLNTIRNKDIYKSDVNILYSGGDDVFAVGRWDKLIGFAKEIRKDFTRFVGREDISISGGVVLIGEKYPIAKAAALAGEAEKNAKQFCRSESNKVTKDAINLFGENVSWKEEFDFVEEIKTDFIRLYNEHNMPRSILHILMRLYHIMRNEDMSYLWHTNYFLKRFSEGKDKEVKEFCLEKLQKLLLRPRNYELVAIAARWAELETKLNKNNK